MTTYHNPALYEEPRNQPMKITPPIPRESLLSWLESSGRFQAAEVEESQDDPGVEDLDSFLESDDYSLEQEEQEVD